MKTKEPDDDAEKGTKEWRAYGDAAMTKALLVLFSAQTPVGRCFRGRQTVPSLTVPWSGPEALGCVCCNVFCLRPRKGIGDFMAMPTAVGTHHHHHLHHTHSGGMSTKNCVHYKKLLFP